ncbi:MAG: hypothetical protein EOP04_01000 [Proteobacteria bacterium]|nr:MAG: hypothetical protein EOP04_01000 [Pseudomonadota bacterium]
MLVLSMSIMWVCKWLIALLVQGELVSVDRVCMRQVALGKTFRETVMTYSEDELKVALRKVRNGFFRSVGVAALVGMAGLFLLSRGGAGVEDDVSASAMLFCGFIVGFFVAGIVLPVGFWREVLKVKKAP